MLSYFRVGMIGCGWIILAELGHTPTTAGVPKAPWSLSGVREPMPSIIVITRILEWDRI